MVDEDFTGDLRILDVADDVDRFLVGSDVPELGKMLVMYTMFERD